MHCTHGILLACWLHHHPNTQHKGKRKQISVRHTTVDEERVFSMMDVLKQGNLYKYQVSVLMLYMLRYITHAGPSFKSKPSPDLIEKCQINRQHGNRKGTFILKHEEISVIAYTFNILLSEFFNANEYSQLTHFCCLNFTAQRLLGSLYIPHVLISCCKGRNSKYTLSIVSQTEWGSNLMPLLVRQVHWVLVSLHYIACACMLPLLHPL